jgi:hypothetical protein
MGVVFLRNMVPASPRMAAFTIHSFMLLDSVVVLVRRFVSLATV